MIPPLTSSFISTLLVVVQALTASDPSVAEEEGERKLDTAFLDDHTLTIGKMFRNGFGVSLDYGNSDRVGPVSVPDDAQLIVNGYYQFGK